MSDKVKNIFMGLRSIWDEPVVRSLPAHLAFFIVLSLVPIMIILFFGAQYFSLPVEVLMNPLSEVLPDAISEILSPTEERAAGLGVGIWIIVALFVGSNGINSVIVGSNALYGFPAANYVVGRLKALLLTLLLVILVLLGIAIIGIGEYLLGVLPEGVQDILGLSRWLLFGLLVFAAVKYMYSVTPSRRIPNKVTNMGTLFTVLGWLIATLAYTFYYANFSNYDALYGSLTNIIVLMIWVYILAFIFVIGLIANVYQYRNLQEGSDLVSSSSLGGMEEWEEDSYSKMPKQECDDK